MEVHDGCWCREAEPSRVLDGSGRRFVAKDYSAAVEEARRGAEEGRRRILTSLEGLHL